MLDLNVEDPPIEDVIELVFALALCRRVVVIHHGRILFDGPLARLGEALDMTRDRPDGFVKAVVIP